MVVLVDGPHTSTTVSLMLIGIVRSNEAEKSPAFSRSTRHFSVPDVARLPS